jgi:enediyne biosynthesis protein E4
VLPSAASAAEPTVQLEAVDELSVPQGLPLRFRAVVTNPSSVAATVSLTFNLEGTAITDPVIPFSRWVGSVGPGSTVVVTRSVTTAQWFEQLGNFAITASTSTDTPVASLAFAVIPAPLPVPRFEDMTAAAGLTTVHRATVFCDNYSAGAAWADVDNDGDLDLYLPHQEAPAQLWVNEGGSFVDRAATAGVANTGSVGIASVFADYDNDSDPDLYVVNDGKNHLYRNNGAGVFEDVTDSAGVGDAGPGTSASWGDYDNDGRLDLYVTNYARCEEHLYYADVLYHNDGGGHFSDRTAILHRTGTTMGAGFQAAWFDYDGDRDQDLYLANDFVGWAPQPNVLWRNDGLGSNGSWKFTNVSVASRTALAINTMGIAVGDYDRDRDLDMALSNIEASVLLRNNGNGTFTNRAAYARVARPFQRVSEKSTTWAMNFSDLNLDGWEDLYAAAGSLGQEMSPEPQPNALFVNGRDGRFLDLSAPSGADDPQMSRGVAVADYDRDGRVDLYVVNESGNPRLYRNVTPTGAYHWLEVDTVGRRSNRDGCGALVTAKLNRTVYLIREVSCGSTGLGSGSDPTVHFGLGSKARVRVLKILWPSGRQSVLRDVSVDRLLTVKEPRA